MTAFAVIAALMMLVALGFVVLPLVRRPVDENAVDRPAVNLAVLRDQLAELDADLAQGTIAPEQHARARAELERRALEEGTGGPAPATRPGGRWAAIVAGVTIPVAAIGLYLYMGSPDAINADTQAHGEADMTPAQVERMVAGLAAKLERYPDDIAGWSLLGRSYYAMGRFPEAVAAYAKAVKLGNVDAEVYADYADALAMAGDRHISEQAMALVNKALSLNPDQPKALVMAATAAYERQDYREAARYFERLQAQLPPDTELARVVAQRIADARSKSEGKPESKSAGKEAGKQAGREAGKEAGKEAGRDRAAPAAVAAAPAAGVTVSGRVALSPALAKQAAPSDTVFILARAAEGPRMPLAILKRQVKDLPAAFTLSDEQAMAPEMRISKFREVVIVVRVSKSGNAAPQPGDLQGATGTVKVGADNVSVTIDTVVP